MWHALTWKKYSFLAGSSSIPSTSVRRFACKISASVSIPWEHRRPFRNMSRTSTTLEKKMFAWQSAYKLSYNQNTLPYTFSKPAYLWWMRGLNPLYMRLHCLKVCWQFTSAHLKNHLTKKKKFIFLKKSVHRTSVFLNTTPLLCPFLCNNLCFYCLHLCSPLLWAPLPEWPSVCWSRPLGQAL